MHYIVIANILMPKKGVDRGGTSIQHGVSHNSIFFFQILYMY